MGTRPLVRSRIEVRISDQAASSLLLSIAALFMLVGIVLLYLAPYPLTLTSRHLLAVGSGWFGAWGSVHYLLRRRLARYDPIIVSLVAMLTGWGLLLQARVAPALLYRQVLWLLIGCAVLVATALTAQLTRILRRYRYLLLTAGIVLLGATLVFGVNPSGYGQELWLGAFGLYIQPSEPLKLLLIIYLAAYLADRRDLPAVKAAGEPMWLIVLGPMVAMVGLALLLLGWQQDLGAAILFYLTFVAMIYLAWGMDGTCCSASCSSCLWPWQAMSCQIASPSALASGWTRGHPNRQIEPSRSCSRCSLSGQAGYSARDWARAHRR